MTDARTPDSPTRENDHSIKSESTVPKSYNREFAKHACLYDLPTDADEHSRLDLQHQMIRTALGGSNYPEPGLVEKVLVNASVSGANILDVGTGSGAWAIEMAKQFPQANVLGVDIVLPDVPETRRPSNCQFKFADVNKDMNTFEPVYDIVHWRLVEAATADTDLFFYEAARILRPGGILIAIGANARIVDQSGVVFPLKKPGHPKYSHYHDTIFRHFEMQLQKGPLRVRHLLWKSILGSNPNFGDVKFQEVYFPLGAWSPDMTNQELQLGKLMNENLQNVIQAIGSGLRQSQSWSQDELNSLLEGALRELKELPPCVQGYSRWVFATAVRSDALWKSREQPWTGPAELDPYDYLIRPANETSSA